MSSGVNAANSRAAPGRIWQPHSREYRDAATSGAGRWEGGSGIRALVGQRALRGAESLSERPPAHPHRRPKLVLDRGGRLVASAGRHSTRAGGSTTSGWGGIRVRKATGPAIAASELGRIDAVSPHARSHDDTRPRRREAITSRHRRDDSPGSARSAVRRAGSSPTGHDRSRERGRRRSRSTATPCERPAASDRSWGPWSLRPSAGRPGARYAGLWGHRALRRRTGSRNRLKVEWHSSNLGRRAVP